MPSFVPNGAHSLGQLRHELDRFFGDLTRNLALTPGAALGRGQPAMNVWETEPDLHVEIELPGLKQDQVEILVMGNELTVKGSRQQTQTNDSVFHRRERIMGNFSRSVRLPVDVDSTKVEASLRNGVLEIRLPKAEAAKPRKIQVNTK